jgi:hypothetical protein
VLEVRAASAYEEFVAPGEFRFRRRDGVDRLDDVVKFRWEMVSRTGEVVGVGLELLVVAPMAGFSLTTSSSRAEYQ